MKEKNKIKDWMPSKVFFGTVLFILILLFVWATTGKATNTNAPSMNLFTFSLIPGDTTAAFWSFWKRTATGSASAGTEYFNHADSHFILEYYNTNHIGEYYGSQIGDLMAWWTAKGHNEPESVLIHWSTIVKQRPSNMTSYTLRPGWNEIYDANNDGIRDSISDWDYNWNQANFTVQRTSSPYYIQNTGGGKSHVTWTVNTWQNGRVVLGWLNEGDTTSYAVDSSNANRIYLATQPAVQTYTWFVVDRSVSWNHYQCSYLKSQSRIYVYDGGDAGEPGVDTAWGTVAVNMSLPDVRTFMGRDCASLLRTWRLSYSGKIGIHKDNVWIDLRNDKCGYNYGFGNGVASILEAGMDTDNEYAVAESTCNAVLNDSVHLNVTGKVMTEGNVGNYKTSPGWYPRYLNVTISLNAIMYEGIMDIDANYSGSNDWLTVFNDARSRGQQIYVLMSDSYSQLDTGVVSNRERFQRGAGVYYTLMGHKQHNDTTASFMFLQRGSYGLSTMDTLQWWQGYAKFNMGYPVGTCSTLSSKIFYRRYDNGIAVYHACTAQGNDTITVSLGSTYYAVKVDGTLDVTPVTSVLMNNYQYCTNSSCSATLWGGQGRLFGKETAPSGQDKKIRGWRK